MLKRFALANISLLLAFILVMAGARDSIADGNGFLLTSEAQQALERGLSATKNQDYRLAVSCFEEGRKDSPNAPELLFNLGLAESNIPGRELVAMVWFKVFLAVRPEAPEAKKVLVLYDRLRATAIKRIREVIALDKEVARKLKDDTERELIFRWIGLCETSMGYFEDARESAELAGRYKADVISGIVKHQTERGDVKGALKLAEATDKSLYRVIALYQPATDNAESFLNTVDLARRFGKWDDYDSGLVMQAFAERGYVDGVMKTAEFTGYKSSIYYYLAEARAKKGDLAGAMKSVLLVDKYSRSSVYIYIAEIQAERGDIRGAIRTAKLAGDSRNSAIIKIAYIQAMRGDFKGVRKTLALVPDLSQGGSLKRKIEIAESLSRTGNSLNLRQRTNVLYEYSWIMKDLNSPNYPWLTDLMSYLGPLSAIDEPKTIVDSVHKLLLGIPEFGSLNGGMIMMFEQVDRLGKIPNYS